MHSIFRTALNLEMDVSKTHLFLGHRSSIPHCTLATIRPQTNFVPKTKNAGCAACHQEHTLHPCHAPTPLPTARENCRLLFSFCIRHSSPLSRHFYQPIVFPHIKIYAVIDCLFMQLLHTNSSCMIPSFPSHKSIWPTTNALIIMNVPLC